MTTSINKIMKNRKNKKGFSLIELIIVLVIMAILAAALVPTLVGYIRQTRQSTAKDEAAACVSASQTIVSSAYADPQNTYYNGSGGANVVVAYDATAKTYTFTTSDMGVVSALAEVKGTLSGVKAKDGMITDAKYVSKNGVTVTYAIDATTGVGTYTVS